MVGRERDSSCRPPELAAKESKPDNDVLVPVSCSSKSITSSRQISLPIKNSTRVLTRSMPRLKSFLTHAGEDWRTSSVRSFPSATSVQHCPPLPKQCGHKSSLAGQCTLPLTASDNWSSIEAWYCCRSCKYQRRLFGSMGPQGLARE